MSAWVNPGSAFTSSVILDKSFNLSLKLSPSSNGGNNNNVFVGVIVKINEHAKLEVPAE